MKKNLKIIFIAGMAAVLLLAGACSSAQGNNAQSGGSPAFARLTDYRAETVQLLAKNTPAPDFQYRMPDGRTIFLSDLKGKVVLLNFWATWCPYCVAEMPYLQEAHDALSSQGLVILGMDTGEPEKDVQKFVSDKKITFQVVLDPDTYASLLYRATNLPTTYLIDKNGNLQALQIGAFNNAGEIINAVKGLLQ